MRDFAFLLMAVCIGFCIRGLIAEHHLSAPGIAEPVRFRSEVEPIRQMVIEKQDAKQLVSFYSSLAERIGQDSEIGSLADVQRINAEEGQRFFRNAPIVGRYPGLSVLVDTVLATGAGSKRHADGSFESVVVDSETRKKLGEAILAVAWACQR